MKPIHLSQQRRGLSNDSYRSPGRRHKKSFPATRITNFEHNSARSRHSSDERRTSLAYPLAMKFNQLPVSVISKITRGGYYLQ